MARSEFAENLKLLCSYYPSIAEVCRRLRINRQQFNKYLGGQSQPSRHNMRLVCEFFGVEEAEILMPHRRFAELVRLRPRQRAEAAQLPDHLAHVERLVARGSSRLDAYVGYYYRYFYSYGFRGQIIRSLCLLGRHGEHYYTKSLGVLAPRHPGKHAVVRFKYLGLPLLINDRIYLVEYETHLTDMLATTILFTSYRKRVDWLMGVHCGIAGNRSHLPAAGRVLFEYLGEDIRLRQAMRNCGMFPADSDAIDPAIKARISNELGPGESVLLVDAQD